MKKAILLAAAAVTMAAGAKAQGIGLGIEAGVNLAAQHTKDGSTGFSSTSSMKAGLRAGVVVDLAVSENFSIQPGVFFSQMGGKISGTYTSPLGNISYSAKSTFNYIQVPVNAVYSINAGAGKFFIGAGPYAAIAVSAKQDSVKIDFSSNGDAKRFDIGADAFVGYKLPVGVYIRAGYNYGFGNIARTPSGATYTDKANNMGFMFTLGYMFGK